MGKGDVQECYGGLLEKSVVEACWRDVFPGSDGGECWRDLLEKSVAQKRWRREL